MVQRVRFLHCKKVSLQWSSMNELRRDRLSIPLSGIALGCLRGVGKKPVVSVVLNYWLEAEKPPGSVGS